MQHEVNRLSPCSCVVPYLLVLLSRWWKLAQASKAVTTDSFLPACVMLVVFSMPRNSSLGLPARHLHSQEHDSDCRQAFCIGLASRGLW
jgi:hypothetical protein